ncbi:hypothetical protein L3i20_v208340 [Paenibacillus sp. L3-i20]|nr:hypothetical protein L3i20_v208340 [Paenibacillus sp. L3-i20]
MPRTAPPPNIVQPFASFTGYKYLQSSLINFNDNKNQKVEISITSQTKSSVQQLGISVVTQKWTGSAWTDFSSTSTINKSNTSSLSEQVTKEIESGYYFRIKVTHTAKQGTVTEQAVEYSQTFVAA